MQLERLYYAIDRHMNTSAVLRSYFAGLVEQKLSIVDVKHIQLLARAAVQEILKTEVQVSSRLNRETRLVHWSIVHIN